MSGALPTLVVIVAMKCGTTSLHGYLAAHPEVGMSEPKELNFFFGPESVECPDDAETWALGNWHRGTDWYAAHFDPAWLFRDTISDRGRLTRDTAFIGFSSKVLPRRTVKTSFPLEIGARDSTFTGDVRWRNRGTVTIKAR